MFVVVNVDDLGIHPAVTRAIVELHQVGTVTSSSILANGPFLTESLHLADSGIGLGVHLNVLRGTPLNYAARVDSLLDGNGLFLGNYWRLFRRYLSNRIDFLQIEREWSMQIERVLDLGIRPTHLDSEKHIHAWPGLMRIALKLAQSYRIAWVRRPVERITILRWDSGAMRARFLNFCSRFHRSRVEIGWPSLVWGIADQAEHLKPDRLASYLARWDRIKVVEIVCHPGVQKEGDPPLPRDYGPMRIDKQWKTEYESLCAPQWLEMIKKMNGILVHYGQIT